ncbi:MULTISPECIES: SIR2 family NAD-dependent protein deacylase [Pseudomonas syringae group]|uniref:NAD-dependent protein deacylase n=2 Tax=Pseudomonas syringae group TaxID=136849 RepID=A0AAW4E458_PSESX|nr:MULTISPECIES: NAD-dependent deacylase [Pseudomonas syringae group]EEB56708.1 cobalamin biosynthetic protein [Pseudomonas syringae pv. tomato T1]KGK92528.1 NAD-dependent deacetylase [Pseudomonas syringae pv. tomato]KUR46773.1 NAD-dependent protein deacylase [Pseudomonas syringae pv. tomato]KUR47548.1 NAD-dependent protein deacylase [Pseudomonas syringae pv. tomato]MBI6696773.1 NAD-dependent deacylase [Pseudomonas syringae]
MTATTLAHQLRKAQHVMVFTGAGASAESGIPTFRDALTGIWERFDPARLATSEAFRADPALCWGWYEWRRHKVLQAQPTGAHLAIAELARYVPKLTVVTQNVDDLHERAGSQDVIHLHGSLHSPRCIDCELTYTLPVTSEALPESGSRIEPQRCTACDGYVRPGVVWFGEMLPEDAWSAGLAAAEECDVFLSIGTSGVVYPAAELPLRALGHGATVAHINPVRFDISSQEHFLQGPASLMMQTLLRDAFG